MSRLIFTGTGRLHFVTTVANKAAPTVAEISAGVELTGVLKRGGFDRSQQASKVDTSDASDKFDKSDVGTRQSDVKGTFFRDSVSVADKAWNTLPIGTTGFMVVAPFGYSGSGTPKAPNAGDRCEVWPVTVANRSNVMGADNDPQTMEVEFATPDSPNDDAVVAA